MWDYGDDPLDELGRENIRAARERERRDVCRVLLKELEDLPVITMGRPWRDYVLVDDVRTMLGASNE